MNINIHKSSYMDSQWELLENNVIRIPKDLRDKLNLETYRSISLDSNDGDFIELCVLPAYEQDERHNRNTAYVTTTNYNKVNMTKAELDKVDQLLIGCDPELFLINNYDQKVVPAVDYFHNNPMDNTVGNDGVLLELRPPPNLESQKVADNIRNLLLKARYKIDNDQRISKLYKPKDLALVGGSFYDTHSAGFHIHFGIPKAVLDPKRSDVRQTVQQIVNILDYYIGITAIAPEPPGDTQRRTNIKVKYGKPGDWRLEFPTLEYRVPGGFLLTHPTFTKGLMGLSWVVMDDILARIKTCTNDFTDLRNIQSVYQANELYPNIFTRIGNAFEVICSPTPNKAMKHLDTIFTDVEDMVSFDKEKKAIINFYNAIVSDQKKEHNIESNWRLSYESEKMEFRTASK